MGDNDAVIDEILYSRFVQLLPRSLKPKDTTQFPTELSK